MGTSRLLQLDEVQIGPFTFDAFLASYIAEQNRGFDSQWQTTGSRLSRDRSPEDGLLGYEALREFVVTVDFKRRKAHLHIP